MKIKLNKHQILYKEKGSFHTYMAIVHTGTDFDVRAVLAHSEENAEKVLIAMGAVDILAVFPLADVMKSLKETENEAFEEPPVNPYFFYDKGENLIH